MAETDENEAKSYELAFEEAGRALDAQERAVNELRSRAAVLIAAAAITTSFFGSRAITGDGLSVWLWVAVNAISRCTDLRPMTRTPGSLDRCSWCSGSGLSCWSSRSPAGSWL
jgi:hypothetical protein